MVQQIAYDKARFLLEIQIDFVKKQEEIYNRGTDTDDAK
jgi:hypothetical protein